MLIKCLKEDLFSALQIIQKGAAVQTTLEILSGLMLEAENDSLLLYATNLEISIKTSIEATVEKNGKTVVPAKLIVDVVKNLPDGVLELSLDPKEGQELTIKAKNSDYKLRALSPEDFPEFPSVDKKLMVKTRATDLHDALRQTLRAVSRDETRPILNGILFRLEEDNLKVVATDSYRLAVRDLKLDSAIGEKTEIVVPWRALDELQKIIPSAAKDINISISENQILFETADVVFISRLIEGQFPNYQQLLPDNYKLSLELEREGFVSAITRAALIAQKNQSIKIKLDSKKLIVTSSTQGVGEAQEELPVNASGGGEIEIAFNAQYLLDGIQGIKNENIKLDLNDSISPGLLSKDNDDSFFYLIMPIRVGN